MIAHLINLAVSIGVYPLYLASVSGWAYFVTLHAARRPWRFLP